METAMVVTGGTMNFLPLSMISAGNNPRKHFDRSELDELEASIRANGVIQPIVVRPLEGGGYAVVAGERRFRASCAVYGLEDGKIPAVVKDMTDDEADKVALIENTVRSDMSVSEEAEAAGKILESVKGNREESARVLGWPLSKLNRRIALLNLIPEAMDALTERKILVGHAELLASVPKDKQGKALSIIMEKGLSVQDVKKFLITASTAFKEAIFDLTRCGKCNYNSSIQSSLFSESIGENERCTDAECFKAKTQTKLNEITFHLKEEVQSVKLIEVGDSGFTKLMVGGASGVGVEQYEACKMCAKLGATVSNVAGEVGKVEREICFDTDCNMSKIAERIKAEKAALKAKEEKPSEKVSGSTATTTTAPKTKTEKAEPKDPKKVADLSAKIKEYRRKSVWEIAVKKELAKQIEKGKSFCLDLLLSGNGNLMNTDLLVGFFGKITGEEYPEKGYSSHKVGAPDSVHIMTAEQQDKLFAAAAVSVISNSGFGEERLKKVLGFLETDLTTHFKLTKEFLELLTKTEIEVVAIEVGLDKKVEDFKKLLSGKKDDLVKGLMAAPFQFEGALPSFLNYK